MMFEEADWLRVDRNKGYGPKPIPQPQDEKITALLTLWMSLEGDSRRIAASGIVEDQRRTLMAFGERMATLAVRQQAETPIVLGLVALCIDGWHGDWRDNATVVSLHYDAAKRIGVSPARPFELAAEMVAPKPAQALRAFLRRSDTDKSLGAMGYDIGSDEDGFRYIRTW